MTYTSTMKACDIYQRSCDLHIDYEGVRYAAQDALLTVDVFDLSQPDDFSDGHDLEGKELLSGDISGQHYTTKRTSPYVQKQRGEGGMQREAKRGEARGGERKREKRGRRGKMTSLVSA